MSSHSSHHPQEVLLAQFSLYVHKGGLKPDSFHFICDNRRRDENVSFENGRDAYRARVRRRAGTFWQ